LAIGSGGGAAGLNDGCVQADDAIRYRGDVDGRPNKNNTLITGLKMRRRKIVATASAACPCGARSG
jgi:hypothetical protein